MIIQGDREYNNQWWLGKVLVDPKGLQCWVNVPKNGSGSIGFYLCRQGADIWYDANYLTDEWLTTYKKYVVLRDPINRFRGCVGELLYHKVQHNTPIDEVEKWLYEQNFFSDSFDNLHMYAQVDYCQGLDIDKVGFFRLHDISEKIPKVIGRHGVIEKMRASMEDKKKDIMLLVDDFMTGEIVSKVCTTYINDYELLKHVQSHKLFI